jgi:hypothetical protein
MPTLDATPAPPNCRLLLVVGIIEKVGMFLVHVHADIFCASHKRVFLSGWFEASTQTLLQKGRPFILSSRAFGPRKLMKVLSVTALFSATGRDFRACVR